LPSGLIRKGLSCWFISWYRVAVLSIKPGVWLRISPSSHSFRDHKQFNGLPWNQPVKTSY